MTRRSWLPLLSVALGNNLPGVYSSTNLPARADANHWLDMVLHLRDEKNLCLDIEGAATHDGANVQLYTCSASGVNWHQRWDFTDDGALVSLLHGKCIDAVQVSSNGANVQVWTCTGALNQKWEYTSLGQFRSLYSGKCLRVSGKEETGANAYMWDCNNGDPLEQWDLKDGKSVSQLPTIATHSGCTCKHSWAVGEAAFTFPHNCVNSVDASGSAWCFVNEPDCGAKNGGQVKLWDFCTPINTDIPYSSVANEHTQKMDGTYNALAQQAAASAVWSSDGSLSSVAGGNANAAGASHVASSMNVVNSAPASIPGMSSSNSVVSSVASVANVASSQASVVSSVGSVPHSVNSIPSSGSSLANSPGGVASVQSSNAQVGSIPGNAPQVVRRNSPVASVGSSGAILGNAGANGAGSIRGYAGASAESSSGCLHGITRNGQCVCDHAFAGTNCDRCAPGFLHYPNCRSSKCAGCVHGTCDPVSGDCACPTSRTGTLCQ